MKKPFNEVKVKAINPKQNLIRAGLSIACLSSFLFLVGVNLNMGHLPAGALAFLAVPALAGYATYLLRK